MTLRQKQSVFVELVGRLIQHAYREGYELTFAETYRTPEQAALNEKTGAGIAQSVHTLRLAVDLNLFKNGKYLTTTEAHQPLGEWWEKLTTSEYQCCWGGRFNDGNHYSIAHAGRK